MVASFAMHHIVFEKDGFVHETRDVCCCDVVMLS